MPTPTLLELADAGPEADLLAAARQPLWRCPRTGIWVVESYALVSDALSRPDDFSSKVSLTVLDAGFPSAEVEGIYRDSGVVWTRTLQTNDPPSHRRFRALVERVFAPAKVAAMSEAIESACGTLLEQWPAGVEFEAMSGFAVPLPLHVIATQLGVPADDYLLFKRWSDAAIHAIGLGATREQHLEAARCGVEFQRYFLPLLGDPQRRPQGSLVDRVALAAAQDEFALNEAEQLSLLHVLMIAGHETTTSTLGSLLLVLAQRPALAERLRGNESLQKRLIEEVLRLRAPVQGLFRMTRRDLEFGGTRLPTGTNVCLRLGAANRDPARFIDAGEPELEAGRAPHLSFGAGIHHCIGAPLARRELAIALRAVLARFARLELRETPDRLRWSRSVMTRALLALPLTGHPHP